MQAASPFFFITLDTRAEAFQTWKILFDLCKMPIFSEGHFGMPGQIRGLSVGAGSFEDENYCPSFSILLGREKLA